ncbi:hypothetical protein NSMM_230002 [Nitrosomonas mobilis]|uniref:Uncharacterized protein n=1 Tax=Nitrosomonas mobilis TaxID=51642 RepID=A0A1G5SDG2_9PROT|nr:hypothetical protein NSMM_230002 [Nitrosomonas mobilis]
MNIVPLQQTKRNKQIIYLNLKKFFKLTAWKLVLVNVSIVAMKVIMQG